MKDNDRRVMEEEIDDLGEKMSRYRARMLKAEAERDTLRAKLAEVERERDAADRAFRAEAAR